MTESEKITAACRKAANRLHHLSMRYAGSLAELGKGVPLGLISRGYPGFREARDLIDLILMVRAEVNGLSNLMVTKGIVTVDELTKEFTEQYDWFTGEKSEFLGVEVNDAGIVIQADKKKDKS